MSYIIFMVVCLFISPIFSASKSMTEAEEKIVHALLDFGVDPKEENITEKLLQDLYDSHFKKMSLNKSSQEIANAYKTIIKYKKMHNVLAVQVTWEKYRQEQPYYQSLKENFKRNKILKNSPTDMLWYLARDTTLDPNTDRKCNMSHLDVIKMLGQHVVGKVWNFLTSTVSVPEEDVFNIVKKNNWKKCVEEFLKKKNIEEDYRKNTYSQILGIVNENETLKGWAKKRKYIIEEEFRYLVKILLLGDIYRRLTDKKQIEKCMAHLQKNPNDADHQTECQEFLISDPVFPAKE